MDKINSGIVLTINGKPIPIHLLFCSKQGCKNTDKPSLLLSMLTKLKKEIEYDSTNWGIDVPSQRKTLTNPTFGKVNLLFFRKSTTRAFYLMDFSSNSLRSVQMWRIWLAHNLIEQMKENLEISSSYRVDATSGRWSLHWLID